MSAQSVVQRPRRGRWTTSDRKLIPWVLLFLSPWIVGLIVFTAIPMVWSLWLSFTNYDPLTDLVPVVQIADVPNVLVVHPSLPVKNFDEFVAYAKANPGKLNYSSTGVGTSSHLSGFMLTERMGTQATHIPYKGADALNDLLSGRIQFMFATIPSVMPHIQAGKLRALAVSSAKRSRSLPDLPTVAEKGFPGFEAGSWFGFFAPKGTPTDVITKVNQAVNDILPSLQAQMIREGADPVGGSPKQFGDFTRKEYVKWKAVVKASGATVD